MGIPLKEISLKPELDVDRSESSDNKDYGSTREDGINGCCIDKISLM